eukprot:3046477-Amphidinium_carterae.1
MTEKVPSQLMAAHLGSNDCFSTEILMDMWGQVLVGCSGRAAKCVSEGAGRFSIFLTLHISGWAV